MFEVGKFYTTEDWTIGGIIVFECIKREDDYARFESSWHNCDGTFKETTPMLKVRTDEHEEYVVLNTFHGVEHRLYAR